MMVENSSCYQQFTMSLLTKLQTLGSDAMNQVAAFYGNNFPMEIRYCLTEFIENQLA